MPIRTYPNAFRPRSTRSPALRCLHSQTEKRNSTCWTWSNCAPPRFEVPGLRIRRSSKSASGNETLVYAAGTILLVANVLPADSFVCLPADSFVCLAASGLFLFVCWRPVCSK